MNLFLKIFFKSLATKIILLTTLLLVVILGVQTVLYVRTETKNLEDVLINNKKDFAELLAINFGAAQSLGGYAFQAQLVEDSGKTQDTVYTRFVKPTGEIYLSNIVAERGQFLKDNAIDAKQTMVQDAVYQGEKIKVVISPSPGGYTTWLGFSLKSIQAAVNVTIISRAMLSVIILLAGAVFALLLALYLTKNIRVLKNAAEEITKGNLKVKTNINTRDEIGDLARSFNHMTERLLQSRTNLEGKIKELSEEHGRMSSLVESVKLGVIMVDLSLNVILANSAAKKVLGGPDAKEITFRDVSEKIKGSVDISQALSYYVHTGTPLNIQEVMIGESYFRLFMSPVRDIIEQVFIGAVVVMEDITEQKKLDKMRTEIVSITSHQLRTPSTIIKGNLEMVLGGEVGEITKDQRELLDDTYLGNQRMIRLINDLMDVAKIDEGKFKLALEPAQLEEVVAEVVKLIAPLAKEKHVTLTYDHPATPFPPVKVNRQRVLQVAQNIIDNAIKYSSNGDKGQVLVMIQEGSKFLELIVKDNGIGIPEDEQDKMFERFSRGSNTTKLDPGGGSGLGLYIAKAVVEQGGGRIWFESKENAGTTFHTTFPYA
ncbi:MAG: ATP-binding protein [Patescibacteria group bacterium]|nr:ATP-binding protein [Patescibacteria group bacterium]